MKQIDVPYFGEITRNSDLGEISKYLNQLEVNNLATLSWPEYTYKPQVRFTVAHNGDCVFLQFNVLEKFVRAMYQQNNDPVSKDSCVEFFVSVDQSDNYYNFEFNCIGTCKFGFGTKNRNMRERLPDELIDQIDRQSLITTQKNNKKGLITWELTVVIPAEVFSYHPNLSFRGLKGRGNFYKCGDDLPQPHFIVWNEVKAPKPDFHRPEFFGKINFL